MTDHYAVVGNPIAHSKSPLIHQQFAEQTGEDIEYQKILAPIDGFSTTIERFFRQGGKGLNITVPFKLAAFEWAQQKSERATYAKAANTLILQKDGTIICDNTDGVGLVRDLIQNHQFDLQAKKILLLGAGGAVQGVLQLILNEQPDFVFIANRTASKARLLANEFARLGRVVGGGFNEIPDQKFDLIINGTSASLSAEVPDIRPELIHTDSCCYDMMYAAEGTPFTLWASRQGAKQVYDGLGMLVEQAAESFFLWRGVRPNTKPVIQSLLTV